MGFLARLASSVVMIFVAATAIYFGKIGMHFLWAICQACMAYELSSVIGKMALVNKMGYAIVIVSVGLFTATYVYAPAYPATVRLVLSLGALCGVQYMLFAVPRGTQNFGPACVGISYVTVVVLLICVLGQFTHVLIRECPGLVLFQFLLVVVNDSFAYIWGVALHHRIWQRGLLAVSPSKSVEGFVGGGVSNVLLVHVVARFAEQLGPLGCSRLALYGYAFYVALLGPLGGFYASLLKRAAGVKDFGHLIPGHGGVTDRCDCQLIGGFILWLILATERELH